MRSSARAKTASCLARHHDRPLLDVQLEKGADGARLDERLAGRDPLHVGAGLFHVFGERAAAVAVPALEVAPGELAEQRIRAEIGLAEPGAFLAAQPEHRQRPRHHPAHGFDLF
jgi:hypothetical protein